MIFTALITLAAGSASALMFASIISGALISLLLFYLAPLPLMVAALGWSAAGAALGGVVAGAALGTLVGFPYFAAFLLTVVLPACWLGHLALLGRPAAAGVAPAAGAPPAMEWYPVGRIIAWTAGLAVLTTMAAMFTLGTDADSINGALRSGMLRVIGTRDNTPAGDVEQIVDALVRIAPGAAAIVAMMTLTLNLFLAGKITALSGRLQRSWPDLNAATLPPMTLAVLSLAIGLSFLGGLVGMIAQTATTALMMAYALNGFATLHTLTRAIKHRGFWLSSTYALVTVFGWPVLLLIALGLADAVFNLRQRYLRRAPPPPVPLP
ncbi:hypothetical protein HNR60_001222 [Rhodopseudomonas rhenobacensis]|uniref:Uncharacterized protein n=1 Tax=Rhodopseudomonas rhenobacensis TaxID=87461 RepID=A0A7W7Z1Y9_9BRAD|nr:hypothetical protein [Rhodopseudomonas rhenobacensis]MBB5046477.1 hypothetical protein [Rhodopseudomonas rhenobacensis]